MSRNKPATAYDLRHAKTIIDVLAMDKSRDLKYTDLVTLARGWKVNPYGTFDELLQRLAQHCQKHYRLDTH